MHESDKFCAFLFLSFFFFLGFCSFTGCFPAFLVNENVLHACTRQAYSHRLWSHKSERQRKHLAQLLKHIRNRPNYEQFLDSLQYRGETNKVWNNTAHQKMDPNLGKPRIHMNSPTEGYLEDSLVGCRVLRKNPVVLPLLECSFKGPQGSKGMKNVKVNPWPSESWKNPLNFHLYILVV